MSQIGWSHDKRERVELAFYQFLRRCFVNTKDYGLICIGDNLYMGQVRAITLIFDALGSRHSRHLYSQSAATRRVDNFSLSDRLLTRHPQGT